jgi:putative FmdB family regulatory protein
MPTYVYECENGDRFELIHSMSDLPNFVQCPESTCGGKAYRVPQYMGIQLKGSGFYSNDKSRP